MYKNFLIVLIFLKVFSSAYCQKNMQNTFLPDVMPASPKAWEFLKFQGVPVSKYTGVPNTSIPIYEIKASGLTMPIELNYHSNGIKVNEESSWTGLGWNLNVGGNIVQVVNEYDDFGRFRYRNNELTAMVNAPNSPISPAIVNTCTNFNFYVQGVGSCMPRPGNILEFDEESYMLNGLKDMTADVFKFNIGNYKGEFILDWQNETFKCLSDPNIKIECPNYYNNPALMWVQPADFKIIMPDGNQFLFELKEATKIGRTIRAFSTPSNSPLELQHLEGEKSSRTYVVTSIITNGGDLITFEYDQTSTEIENLPSVSQTQTDYSFERIIGGNPNTGYPPTPIFTLFPSNVGTTINYSKQSFAYLKTITFPQGKILFSSSNNRIDLIGSKRLDYIEIQNNSLQTIKKTFFNYNYFIGNTSGNNIDAFLNDPNYYVTGKQSSELTHRLKLESVWDDGMPAHTFEYDTESLPKKTSVAVDLWGFYNKHFTNVGYTPNLLTFGIPKSIGIGNNNSSNLIGTKAGVLKKIIFPTGGSSAFDYELNTFSNFNIPDEDHSETTDIYINDRNNTGDNPGQIFYSDAYSSLYAGELNINTYGPMSGSTTPNSAYIRLSVFDKTPENLAHVTTGIASFWANYYSSPIGQLGNHFNGVVSDSKLISFEWNQATQSYETFKLLQNYSMILSPNKIYVIQAFLDQSFGPQTNVNLGANASASFKYLKNTSHAISKGGGLRIKTIRTTSGDNTSPDMIKKYAYTGGKLMGPLNYISKQEFNYEYWECFTYGSNPAECPFGYDNQKVLKTTVNSASYSGISTNASGRYIGYDEVEESDLIEVNGNFVDKTNGSILEKYTNTPDIGMVDPSVVNTPPTNFGFDYPLKKASIENGLLLNRQVKNSNEIVVEETINQYFPTATKCFYGRLTGYSGQVLTWQASRPCNHYIYSVGFYSNNYNKTLLASTTDKKFENGIPFVEQKTYTYDVRDQISTVTKTDSRQNNQKITFKYPYDYTSYNTMANLMITPVIEEIEELITSSSTLPVSITKKDYFFNGGVNPQPGTWQIQEIFKASGSSTLRSEITYDLYGEYNAHDKYKVRQYHDKSGVTTSIIWGYGGQLPVAKIIGKNYNDALSQSGIDLLTLNNMSSTSSQIRSELNKLYLLTGCYVSTYTYKPLVGILTETDPKQRTTFFEYDQQNRLRTVRNHENKIIKTFCYNYAGSLQNCTP